MTQRLASQLIKVSIAGLAFSFVSLSYGSAFQLFEQDAGSLGTAHAGYAAEADNASTGFYNPAGLVRIKHQQVSLGGELIHLKANFQGTSQVDDHFPPDDTVINIIPKSNADTKISENAFVPNFHYAAPVSDRVTVGFGVTAPFGLQTNWGTDSLVKYAQVESSVKAINISPSLGFAITDKFSLGAGLDAERLEAVFSQVADEIDSDYLVYNKGHAWGYGWHAGALYQFSPTLRVGVSYRSPVSFKIRNAETSSTAINGGDASFNNSNNNASADVKLPSTTAFSVFDQVMPKLSVMASAVYTRWTSIKDITLRNVDIIGEPGTIVVPQNFRNTWYIALGSQYKLSDKLTLKGGLAYDQSPTNNTDRNLRLPDANKIILSTGLRYQITKKIRVDLSYAHAFVQNAGINNTSVAGPDGGASQHTIINGNVKSSADIIGTQLIWNIT